MSTVGMAPSGPADTLQGPKTAADVVKEKLLQEKLAAENVQTQKDHPSKNDPGWHSRQRARRIVLQLTMILLASLTALVIVVFGVAFILGLQEDWEFTDALYFSAGSISTNAYGPFQLSTETGRILFIFLAIFGYAGAFLVASMFAPSPFVYERTIRKVMRVLRENPDASFDSEEFRAETVDYELEPGHVETQKRRYTVVVSTMILLFLIGLVLFPALESTWSTRQGGYFAISTLFLNGYAVGTEANGQLIWPTDTSLKLVVAVFSVFSLMTTLSIAFLIGPRVSVRLSELVMFLLVKYIRRNEPKPDVDEDESDQSSSSIAAASIADLVAKLKQQKERREAKKNQPPPVLKGIYRTVYVHSPTFAVVVAWVLVLFIQYLIYALTENWSSARALWFSFATMTTLGAGNITLTSSTGQILFIFITPWATLLTFGMLAVIAKTTLAVHRIENIDLIRHHHIRPSVFIALPMAYPILWFLVTAFIGIAVYDVSVRDAFYLTAELFAFVNRGNIGRQTAGTWTYGFVVITIWTLLMINAATAFVEVRRWHGAVQKIEAAEKERLKALEAGLSVSESSSSESSGGSSNASQDKVAKWTPPFYQEHKLAIHLIVTVLAYGGVYWLLFTMLEGWEVLDGLVMASTAMTSTGLSGPPTNYVATVNATTGAAIVPETIQYYIQDTTSRDLYAFVGIVATLVALANYILLTKPARVDRRSQPIVLAGITDRTLDSAALDRKEDDYDTRMGALGSDSDWSLSGVTASTASGSASGSDSSSSASASSSSSSSSGAGSASASSSAADDGGASASSSAEDSSTTPVSTSSSSGSSSGDSSSSASSGSSSSSSSSGSGSSSTGSSDRPGRSKSRSPSLIPVDAVGLEGPIIPKVPVPPHTRYLRAVSALAIFYGLAVAATLAFALLEESWNTATAMYYTASLFTLNGIGDVLPSKDGSKAATVLFAVIGAIAFLRTFILFFHANRALLKSLRRRIPVLQRQNDDPAYYIMGGTVYTLHAEPLLVTVVAFVVVIFWSLIGMALMSNQDIWGSKDMYYASLSQMMTLGFYSTGALTTSTRFNSACHMFLGSVIYIYCVTLVLASARDSCSSRVRQAHKVLYDPETNPDYSVGKRPPFVVVFEPNFAIVIFFLVFLVAGGIMAGADKLTARDAYLLVFSCMSQQGNSAVIPDTDGAKFIALFISAVAWGTVGYVVVTLPIKTREDELNARIARLFPVEKQDFLKTVVRVIGPYVKLIVLLCACILFFMLGALIFSLTENFSALDGFYFSAITSTTIGLGDLAPATLGGRIAFIFYSFFGLGLIGYTITVLQEVVEIDTTSTDDDDDMDDDTTGTVAASKKTQKAKSRRPRGGLIFQARANFSASSASAYASASGSESVLDDGGASSSSASSAGGSSSSAARSSSGGSSSSGSSSSGSSSGSGSGSGLGVRVTHVAPVTGGDEDSTSTPGWKAIMVASVQVAAIFLIGSIMFSFVEGLSSLDGTYYSAVLLTTVGYGTPKPLSREGKILTLLYVLLGIGFVANLIGLIGDLNITLLRSRTQSLLAYLQRGRAEGKTGLIYRVPFDAFLDLLLGTTMSIFWLGLGTLMFSQTEGWTFLEALYFSTATLTTVGYGDLSPATNAGKVLFIIYAIFGLGVVTLVASAFGTTVIRTFRAVMRFIRHQPGQEQQKMSPFAELILAIVILLIVFGIGAVGFYILEDWDKEVSSYVTIATITTIGYGDIAPSTDGGRIFFIFYAFLAIASLGIILSALQELSVQSLVKANELRAVMARQMEYHNNVTMDAEGRDQQMIALVDKRQDQDSSSTLEIETPPVDDQTQAWISAVARARAYENLMVEKLRSKIRAYTDKHGHGDEDEPVFQYEDPDFIAERASLFVGRVPRVGGNRVRRWSRPKQILRDMGIRGSPTVYVDGEALAEHIEINNPVSTIFLTTLGAATSRNGDILTNILFDNKKYGIYTVMFWQDGKWVPITIDDRLPVDKKGHPRYAGLADGRGVWVAIMEKARAKLMGSYEALETDDAGDVLYSLYGASVTAYNMTDKAIAPKIMNRPQAKQQDDESQATEDLSSSELERHIQAGLARTPQTAPPSRPPKPSPADLALFPLRKRAKLATFSPSQCWGVLRRAVKQGPRMVFCGSFTDRPTTRSMRGVLQDHIYGVIGLGEYEETQLVHVRDPWRRVAWEGPWSDNSAEMTEDAQEHLGHELGDGTFWIRLTDFLTEFTTLYIATMYNDDKFVTHHMSAWGSGTSGGDIVRKSCARNPQFFLFVKSKTEVTVTVTQMRKSTESRSQSLLPIGVVIANKRGKRLKNLFRGERHALQTPMKQHTISAKATLLPLPDGRPYTVMAFAQKPNQHAQFQLRFYADKPIQTERILPTVPAD